MNDPNPYESPQEDTPAESPAPRSRISALFWPRTKGGCIVLTLFAWPVVATLTDILGAFIGPYLAIEDFGLAVLNFTLPVTWLYAIVIWMRGFTIDDRSGTSIVIGLMTLPFWFLATGCMNFFLFPFGRINPNF